MSVNFSTIKPLDPATISRKPAFSVENETPVASTPINKEAKKKSSHWFAKTVIGAVVLAAAAALATKHVNALKNIVEPAKLADNAKLMDQITYYGKEALYYGKKGVAAVGNFVLEKTDTVVNWGKSLIEKMKAPSA